MFNKENLHASLSKLGISNPGDIFERLEAAYTDSTRFYHNETHVSECLKYLYEYSYLANNITEIEIAIWFHDAIYDTHRNDNEELSAAWANDYLNNFAITNNIVKNIYDMIICTKTHVADNIDAQLMLDIDLSVLGASNEVFESYDKKIRKEYHWISELDYRKGRIEVLESFLKRENIYHTSEFSERFDKKARNNLSRKIKELSSSN